MRDDSRNGGLQEAAAVTPVVIDDLDLAERPGRFPSPNPLAPGCPGLFIQTGGTGRDLLHAADLIKGEGMGIVCTIDSRSSRPNGLRDLVRVYQCEVGPVDHMMIDANYYSGKLRRVGGGIDASWIRLQRAAGLQVQLTDSPYVPANDRKTLSTILTEAAKLGDGVVAVLPLDLSWLTHNVEVLIDEVNRAMVPIALVLEHKGDPLGVQKAVTGLVSLLIRSQVKVGLLRNDLSVIGAVAFGASFGAVGATSGLRHLYPIPDDDKGRPLAPAISAVVPSCLAYRTLAKINVAVAADADHQERWRCGCRYCYNRTLDVIVSPVGAFQHSLAAIALIGERVLDSRTRLEAKHAWVEACRTAQVVNLEVESDTGLTWGPPTFLGAWHKQGATLPPLIPVTA